MMATTEADKAVQKLLGKPVKGRAPKGVTLGRHQFWDKEHGIVRDRDAEKAAAERQSMTATPERAAKAAIVEAGKADKVQRITEAPLDVLFHRRSLAKSLPSGKPDIAQNERLYNAGDRLRKHWQNAGLIGIAAMDMGRIGMGGENSGFPFSEFACHHRDEVKNAIDHLGSYMAQCVVGVVVEERSLEEVGRAVSGRMDRSTATAIAVDLLRGGLCSLAGYFDRRPGLNES